MHLLLSVREWLTSSLEVATLFARDPLLQTSLDPSPSPLISFSFPNLIPISAYESFNCNQHLHVSGIQPSALLPLEWVRQRLLYAV